MPRILSPVGELIYNELSVILKGQGDSYVLAVWNDKEYS